MLDLVKNESSFLSLDQGILMYVRYNNSEQGEMLNAVPLYLGVMLPNPSFETMKDKLIHNLGRHEMSEIFRQPGLEKVIIVIGKVSNAEGGFVSSEMLQVVQRMLNQQYNPVYYDKPEEVIIWEKSAMQYNH